MNTDMRNWFAGFYDFVGFASATGLKAPDVATAYNDFRTYTFALQRREGNGYYGYDGIISEAFERWCREQTRWNLT